MTAGHTAERFLDDAKTIRKRHDRFLEDGSSGRASNADAELLTSGKMALR